MEECLVVHATLSASDIISFTDLMQKICPVCNRKYSEEHNFCSKHSNLVKLVYIKDLVKICPKCHKKYTKDDNFCGFHDEAIELCYIDDLTKQCKACGSKYPENYNYCIRCEWDGKLEKIGEPEPPKRVIRVRDIKIKPNRLYNFKKHKNNFTELDDLLSNENIELLEKFDFTHSQFDDIIDNIIKIHNKVFNDLIESSNIDFDRLHILDKILLFSKSFVKTDYKEGGGDLGHFAFNEIYIDDRQENALQITSIIHELSHFLFAEILEQVVSAILNTDKTDALEAFVCYTLVKDVFFEVIDEYCAHTVEGRFAILGYQDYGSFESLLTKFKKEHYTNDHLEVAKAIGNTFAGYIKFIMESFIDETLREDIKKEFLNLKDEKNYKGMFHETDNFQSWDKFKDSIRLMLTRNIDEIISNKDDIERLYSYTMAFKKNNS